MRITQIDLYSSDTSYLRLPIVGASPRDPYLVKAVIGLDADEIAHAFYAFGGASALPMHRFTLPKREIIIRAQVNPDYILNEVPADLRDEIYRMIASNRNGMIHIRLVNEGSVVAHTTAWMKKLEVPHFSRIPELQLTLECDDPIFRAMSNVEVPSESFLSYGGLSVYLAYPLVVVDSQSTAPHGFEFALNIGTTISTLTIKDKDTDPEWTFKITPGTIGGTAGFVDTDYIYFSSVEGEAKLQLLRGSTNEVGGTLYDIMDKVDVGSVWPIMFPGKNEFYIPELENIDLGANLPRFYYKPAYWGV